MILNLLNGKRYIGSAVCFRLRQQGHWSRLRHNAHHSAHLQAAWNKYGPESFRFEIVEVMKDADNDALRQREDHYIQVFKPEYNMSPEASRPTRSEDGIKRTAASLAKRYRVTSPDGEIFDVKNLKAFCRERGLTYKYLWAVARGRQGKTEDGWRAEHVDKQVQPYQYYQPVKKRLFKDGLVYEFDDIDKFAAEHGMKRHCVANVLHRQAKISNGFSLPPEDQ